LQGKLLVLKTFSGGLIRDKLYKSILSYFSMEVKILKDEKDELDLEINSLTIAELLRVYLNKEGADIVAWKRDHPKTNPVLHIKSDNPKKLVKKAISTIEKELKQAQDEFKKLK
jgi:DNA-directed RNA polymerase subunit L